MESPEHSINAEATDDRRWNILSRKVSEARIVSVFDRFSALGIDPILIKGWSAARWYPDSAYRPYIDIDLAVSRSDYETLTRLSREVPGLLAGVDLHRELRHLDTLSWEKLFDRSELIDMDGCPIRVLAPEDHLRVIAIHWLNDGGANKDRLWDIYYAISNRPPDFDWGKCLNVVSRRRRRWVITAVGITHKYLGLPIDDLPFADEAREIPDWLIRTLEKEWAAGIPMRGLETCLNDPKEFFRQLKKRVPPNPIQATIEVEGEFDNSGRAKYQIKDIVKRIRPSLKRITNVLFRK